jgi:hypothetical protein
VPEEQAIADFRTRLTYYKQNYVPLDSEKDCDKSFIKV